MVNGRNDGNGWISSTRSLRSFFWSRSANVGSSCEVLRLIANFPVSQMTKSCTKTRLSIVCKKPWHSLNPLPTLDGSQRLQLSFSSIRLTSSAKSCLYHLYQILSPTSEEVMITTWLALFCLKNLWGWIIAPQRASMLITQMPRILKLWSSSYLLSSEPLHPISIGHLLTNRPAT